jgi:hypothetical protein
VERVVRDALPTAAALPPDICAFGNPPGIVSGEADSPRFHKKFSRGIAISNV